MLECSTVYHLLIDRFQHPDGDWAAAPAAEDYAFRGGSLAGITMRIRQGWFCRLGVRALLLNAPYQQIVGWLPDASGRYTHFAYHGYWPLDFTVIDARFGNEADLHELVDAAHARGIRVLLDVVLGHAGYQDLQTVARYSPQLLSSGWQRATPSDYSAYLVFDPRENPVWGREWIGGSASDAGQHSLPQFALSRPDKVGLPPFLKSKPDTKAIFLPDATVRDYVVSWLTRWVSEFGIDGFRCDSVKHVPMEAWHALKRAGCAAASGRKFWMTGEVFGHGIERDAYFDHGFDSLINFSFQTELRAMMELYQQHSAFGRELYYRRLDRLYQRYAAQFSQSGSHEVLSYISSHDTFLFDRARLLDAATALMLAPGDVMLFYGDECARPAGSHNPDDPAQATRSVMNWKLDDEMLLRHWQTLGQFRTRHPAVAYGQHLRLSSLPYAFRRRCSVSGDTVIAVLGYTGSLRLRIDEAFAEGSTLADACSGATLRVAAGHIELSVDGMALLELQTSASDRVISA